MRQGGVIRCEVTQKQHFATVSMAHTTHRFVVSQQPTWQGMLPPPPCKNAVNFLLNSRGNVIGLCDGENNIIHMTAHTNSPQHNDNNNSNDKPRKRARAEYSVAASPLVVDDHPPPPPAKT